MSRYRRRYDYGYPRYVSVGERRAKAEKKIEQLKKKNPDICPVVIEGTKIAHSWWGISWNKNLESYADYANRIGRGRSYVRHGSVLDLQIKEGKILSLVQGSSSRPYKVEISITKIKSSVWKTILDECRGLMDSLQAIVDGKLPKAMEALLTRSGNGMFPAPNEIRFSCSCPDAAYMCKHVAATLYGVGARLDHDPSLFFTLRGVEMEDLVSETVKEEAETLRQRAKKKDSHRIIDGDGADLSATFGIDMDLSPAPTAAPLPSSHKKAAAELKSKTSSPKKRLSRRKKATPPATKATPPVAKTTAAAPSAGADTVKTKKSSKNATGKSDDYQVVVSIIRRRRVTGIGVKEIKTRTDLEETKIRNIIARAKRNKEIQNISRGLYIKAR